MDKDSIKFTRAKYFGVIDTHVFRREVERLRQDRYTKKLTTLKFVKAIDVFADPSYPVFHRHQRNTTLPPASVVSTEKSRCV